MPPYRIALICSRFNSEITDRMMEAAVSRCTERGAEIAFKCRVPGAFDIPPVASMLVRRGDIDGAVALGAIIRGETSHDVTIAQALAIALSHLSVETGKPVALGVSGPGMTWEQASTRAEEYATRGVDAVLDTLSTLEQIRGE